MKKKYCPKCEKTVPIAAFAKNKTKKDGLGSECRACATARSKQWVIDNPERVRKWRKQHYAATQEKQRTRAKDWHHANKDRARAQGAKWREVNKYRIKIKKRLDATGFTEELFQATLKRQGNACAICRCDLTVLPSRYVHADHCHTSRRPRGVLCHHCNVAIGHFKDSPDLLRAAINYLRKPPAGVRA